MIIPRKIYREIEKYIESRQALVITGMRRVGKTTLMKFFFNKIKSSNKLFLDLEDPLNRDIFSKINYQQIKTNLEKRGIDFSKKHYLFLDEIQFCSHLPSVVKYFFDHYQSKFFLTGSASFYLKNLFSESLSGRKYLFEMYPLDFSEFLIFKNVKFKLPSLKESVSKNIFHFLTPFLDEYLNWGGMPEVVLQSNPQEKQLILRDIFSSYFQKEIMTLGDFRKNEVLKNLIFLLAKRVGQKVDILRLSQELGVGRQTVYEYLDFLSGTYFINLLPAYGGPDVRVRKQRKVYFVDCGILNIFSNVVSGAIFENAVFQNLLSKREKIYYYEKGKGEIDFIIENKERYALEIKETAYISDYKKLRRLSEGLSIKNYFLITKNYSQDEKAKYLWQIEGI